MMMSDLSIDSDRRFMAMTRDFLEYYRGKDVSTYDFCHECELYFNQSLDWFFDQWVFDSDLPVYTCRHLTEPAADGEYTLWLEITQTGVPADFQMPVPVTVTFRGRPPYRQHVQVVGDVTTARLGPFRNRPERIVFNDFDGVLTKKSTTVPQLADDR
jgi:aminopeptidase N